MEVTRTEMRKVLYIVVIPAAQLHNSAGVLRATVNLIHWLELQTADNTHFGSSFRLDPAVATAKNSLVFVMCLKCIVLQAARVSPPPPAAECHLRTITK